MSVPSRCVLSISFSIVFSELSPTHVPVRFSRPQLFRSEYVVLPSGQPTLSYPALEFSNCCARRNSFCTFLEHPPVFPMVALFPPIVLDQNDSPPLSPRVNLFVHSYWDLPFLFLQEGFPLLVRSLFFRSGSVFVPGCRFSLITRMCNISPAVPGAGCFWDRFIRSLCENSWIPR